MDQLTHTVRRSNWINIIRQCQDRPEGITGIFRLKGRLLLRLHKPFIP